MAVSLEKTDIEYIIRVPTSVESSDVQLIFEQLKFLEIVSRSKATEDDIQGLSRAVKAGWSKEIKEKLAKMDEFKDLF